MFIKPICLENTCPTRGLTAFNGKVKKIFWLNKIFCQFFCLPKIYKEKTKTKTKIDLYYPREETG